MKTILTAKNYMKKYGLFTALLFLLVGTSMAATTDTTFATVYQTVRDWSTGTLGRLLALSAFLIGMGIGLVKQSAMAVVLGIAFALILAYGPTVIEGIFGFAVAL